MCLSPHTKTLEDWLCDVPVPAYKKQQDMEQQVKYEEAMRQLEEIVEKIENNELDIDQLTSQLKKAKELITLCKDKLVKTDEELKKILEE